MTSPGGPFPGRVRSFIAIELPPEVHRVLADIQAALRPISRDIRWVAPEGVHLTLNFLDSIPAATVPRVAAALAALEGKPSFSLSLGPTGAFPNWRAPRVIWTGLAGDLEALATLHQQVEVALEPLGFPRDSRPFSPHLTLGRVRDRVRPESLGPLAQAAQALGVEPAPFAVAGVTLFRSTLTPRGAVYSALAQVRLGTTQ